MKASLNERVRLPNGMVFVPILNESHFINELIFDTDCPLSKQPDYKKCAMKLERV
jgi:nitrate reductase NapA